MDESDVNEEVSVSARELVQQVHNQLADRQTISTAANLLGELQRELKRIGRQSAFFESQGLSLQEAWVGVEFGRIMKFDFIQLAPKAQQGFDIILEKDGTPQKFDVTEATDRSFDRAHEYRTGPEMVLEDDTEITRQENLFKKSVGNRLKRKSSDNLIVYVNTGWLPDDQLMEEELSRWHQNFKGKFKSAYLLIRGGIVQIAPEFNEFSNWRLESRTSNAEE